MGLFSSSSTSSEAASSQPQPTRESRKACWDKRDVYFACLTQKNIIIPPGTDMSDGRGPTGKAEQAAYAQKQKERQAQVQEQREKDPCKTPRGPYEENCAKSWVEYFNKRRVLEERQRLLYASGAQPLPNASS